MPSKLDIIEETQVTVEEWKTAEDVQETEYSVLHPTVIVTEEVSTLPASLSSSVSMQGNLLRKHDLEGPLKKAQNRSWNNVFCVLKENDLFFYKDLKSFSLNETLQGEETLFLGSASCEAVADYKKKKHVFRLRLSDGNEWLFQGKDEADRQNWIDTFRTSIAETSDQKPKSRSLPLPTTSAAEVKPEKKEKRFSLFPSKK